MDRQDVCFCLPNFAGGGAEKVFLTLMHAFSSAALDKPTQKFRDNALDEAKRDLNPENLFEAKLQITHGSTSCVVLSAEGPLKSRIPSNCVIHNLEGRSAKRGFFKLIQHFKKTKPAIIVSNLAYLNFIVVLSLIFARHRPCRLVLREANTPQSTIRALKVRPVGKILYKHLYKYADVVICNSMEISNSLRELGVPTDIIKLIPNPIDVAEVRELANQKCKLPEFTDASAPLLISIGRLTEQKGFDRLIEWFSEIQCNANLLIVGDGPFKDRLNRQIRTLNKRGQIKIIGFQPNPFSLIKRASAVLLASRWEGLPNIGLEALALGKPVIASVECGGLVELADEFSIEKLKIVGSGSEFVRAIVSVIKDGGADDASKLPRSKLPTKYKIENVLKRYIESIYG